MSWTEQRCSSELLMGQDKDISLLPTAMGEKMHATVKNQSLLFIAVNSYHLNVFYDQSLTGWNLALRSTNTQSCPHSEKCCLSAMTILWYYLLFSSSSIITAEPNAWLCRWGCVIITNKSWHFNGDCCTLGIPLIMFLWKSSGLSKVDG